MSVLFSSFPHEVLMFSVFFSDVWGFHFGSFPFRIYLGVLTIFLFVSSPGLFGLFLISVIIDKPQNYPSLYLRVLSPKFLRSPACNFLFIAWRGGEGWGILLLNFSWKERRCENRIIELLILSPLKYSFLEMNINKSWYGDQQNYLPFLFWSNKGFTSNCIICKLIISQYDRFV